MTKAKVLNKHGFKITVPADVLRNGAIPLLIDNALEDVDHMSAYAATKLNERFGIEIEVTQEGASLCILN